MHRRSENFCFHMTSMPGCLSPCIAQLLTSLQSFSLVRMLGVCSWPQPFCDSDAVALRSGVASFSMLSKLNLLFWQAVR